MPLPISKARNQKLYFLFFLTVCIRLFFVVYGDKQPDYDEASILSAGYHLWGQFPSFFPYVPYAEQWEAMFSYIFSAVDLLINPRWLSFLLGIVDIMLVYKIVKKYLSEQIAFYTVICYMFTPWHIYYSSILGTCNPVTTVALLAFYYKNRTWSPLLHLLGFLIYPTYRIFALGLMVWEFFQKRWKQALLPVVGGLLAVILVALSSSTLYEFFWRGHYNFYEYDIKICSNYLYTLVAPFVAPLDYYNLVAGIGFMADYVHYGLSSTLGMSTPLLYPISIAVLTGLYQSFKNIRSKKYYVPIIALVATYLFLGFMGPSLSRFLIILPVLSLMGGYGLERLASSNKAWVVWTFIALMFVSLALFVFTYTTSDVHNVVFHSRFSKIEKYLYEHSGQYNKKNTFLIAHYGVQTAQYLSVYKNAPFTTLATTRGAKHFETIMKMNKLPRGYIVLDKIPSEAFSINGVLYRNYEDERETVIQDLRKRLKMTKISELVSNGKPYATLYQYVWKGNDF